MEFNEQVPQKCNILVLATPRSYQNNTNSQPLHETPHRRDGEHLDGTPHHHTLDGQEDYSQPLDGTPHHHTLDGQEDYSQSMMGPPTATHWITKGVTASHMMGPATAAHWMGTITSQLCTPLSQLATISYMMGPTALNLSHLIIDSTSQATEDQHIYMQNIPQ